MKPQTAVVYWGFIHSCQQFVLQFEPHANQVASLATPCELQLYWISTFYQGTFAKL
jgi:hypothetical protein